MILDLTPDELLTTTRSVRKRLDLERPVERSVIEECIDVAIQAPTGSNAQGWHWVVVEDAALKRQIADHYAASFDPYIDMPGASYVDADPRAQRQDAVKSSATYLREHFHEVPAMVIPCQWGRLPDDAPSFAHASYWGSILPAVWSFMLALRARGLGSAWTTLHLPREREVADLLGIPFDQCTQAGLFPVAYTKGTDFKKASRVPASDIIHWDHW
ncbi:MAG: nitroreductase family protein [Actinomycetota bacterium]|nr:nitroreductase family protein [Actinomycetota bacterium]